MPADAGSALPVLNGNHTWNSEMKHHTAKLAAGLLVFVVLACNLGEQNANNSNSTPQPEASVQEAQPSNAAPMHVAALVKEFETNEVRANQQWVGKRVRVHGTVNTIEIGKDGNIVLTFKSSISTYNNGRCFFNKSQSSHVAALNAHEEATVEGTVRGLGGGFDNSKAFLLLENCIIP